MEEHELLHVVREVLRISKRPHPVARHPRSHHLVVMEGDPSGRELSGIGFPDVVEQGREPKAQSRRGLLCHGDRVRQHVLVMMYREVHAVG